MTFHDSLMAVDLEVFSRACVRVCVRACVLACVVYLRKYIFPQEYSYLDY